MAQIKIIFFVSSFLSLVMFPVLSFAQTKDQTFKNWTVYTTTMDNKKLCYILSMPQKKTGNTTKRGGSYLIVTNITNTIDEVSTSSGYPYKEHSKVKIILDSGKNYLMSLIQGEVAWIKEEKLERELITAFKNRQYLDVKGVSTKGTYSIDRYSLIGFSTAYNRMKSLCK